jgi:tetratricopeptide (TPR) repeat protein
MPSTINGIGTHYYGRGNRSEVIGRCEFCGRSAKLTSYDTWECFCLVYIPIIPLGRYRILNDCASCRRHNRIKLSEFRRMFDEQVVPLREQVAARPRDAEARRGLVAALAELQMWTEADREARAGVAELPEDPELNRLAGEIAAYRGDKAGATPYLRKAADLAPDSAAQRTELGQHLLELGQTEEAIRELGEAQARDSSHWQASYWLGQAHLRAKRWSEALPALERVLSLQPDLADDEELLGDIARCKRALHYPLSPREEKVSKRRWWWPFGRRGTPASKKPAAAIPAWVILPLLAAAVLVFLGVAVWRQQHVRVYFDNGLEAPVKVTVGSETFSLTPQQLDQRSLAPGIHPVTVTGPKGPIEEAQIQPTRLGLWDALFSSRFYVYNVAERHIYQRWSVVYSTRQAPPTGRAPASKLIALQRFFAVEDVDYAFVTPPDSISMDSGTSVTTRAAFDVVRDLDFASLAAIRMDEGQPAEAARAARKAVEIDGCALRARRTLVLVLLSGHQPDTALPEIDRWRDECPDAGIELERTYQDAMRATGREEELRREYEARLAHDATDAAAHYLLGRLIEDPRGGLEHERQAVRLDPSLGWAHVAMAHDLLALERPAEAFDALSAALDLPHPSIVLLPFAHAAIASGRQDVAQSKLDAIGQSTLGDASLLEARWLLALARQDWPEATRLDKQLTHLTEDEAESARRKGTVAALQQQQAAPPVPRLGPKATPPAAEIHFQRLAGQGQHKEAVAALDGAYARARLEIPADLQLHAAAELLLAGEREAAEKRLREVEDALAEAPAEPRVVFLRSGAAVLRGAAPASQLIEAARRSGYLDLDDAYYWAAVRAQLDGQSRTARQHGRRSAELCCDYRFPYLAARRLADSSE